MLPGNNKLTMKVLVYMGHPAHFHLLKNPVRELENKGHQVIVLIQEKDILEDLIRGSGFTYKNILAGGRKDTKLGLAIGMIKRDTGLLHLCLKEKPKPDIMMGTSVEIPHIGKLLRIPTINLNEDDCRAVPLYCKLSYPFSSVVLAPNNCDTGKWEKKTVHYNGYHELAYLHPHVFQPQKEVVEKQLSPEGPYFILRFAKLTAHHDAGKTGITTELAREIIKRLTPHGRVFITSQRELEPEFELYRIPLNPLDMHHALYYAGMYLGDSQTMTAEAAVLGTPALRFNDFVGKLGYLEELEHKYGLTYGIKTSQPEKLFEKIEELLKMKDRKHLWQQRRQKMLDDKIDVTAFIVWFIENYPNSAFGDQGGSFRENRPPGPPTKAFD
jgi:predicted glycosyltransferase